MQANDIRVYPASASGAEFDQWMIYDAWWIETWNLPIYAHTWTVCSCPYNNIIQKLYIYITVLFIFSILNILILSNDSYYFLIYLQLRD